MNSLLIIIDQNRLGLNLFFSFFAYTIVMLNLFYK